jgi:hypothetical protein
MLWYQRNLIWNFLFLFHNEISLRFELMLCQVCPNYLFSLKIYLPNVDSISEDIAFSTVDCYSNSFVFGASTWFFKRFRPLRLSNVPGRFWAFHDSFWSLLALKRLQTVKNAHRTFRNAYANSQKRWTLRNAKTSCNEKWKTFMFTLQKRILKKLKATTKKDLKSLKLTFKLLQPERDFTNV